MTTRATSRIAQLLISTLVCSAGLVATDMATRPATTKALVAAGGMLVVNVPEAIGGKTVFGQVAVDGVTSGGFVTAYGCDDGLPKDGAGNITKADLNFNGPTISTSSNRLIVKADNDGDICFYTSAAAEMIIDINGYTSTGVTAVPNKRTDTRTSGGAIAAGGNLRVNVATAVGGKTVFGQVAVDAVQQGGFVTAYGCDDGLPKDGAGNITKADLNFNGPTISTSSNRLIVKADNDGDICFYTSAAAEMIIDINGYTSTGVTAVPNKRTDTRTSGGAIAAGGNLRVNVATAIGGKTVFGQVAVDAVQQGGFVTAYGCDDGLPKDGAGNITKADLNFNGPTISTSSNRLIVKADNDGDICFYTSALAHLIVDINGYTSTGVTAITNRRTDTRTAPPNPGDSKDCSDFTTYAEAKAWFDIYYPHYGDIAKLDSDGDLMPCESLIPPPPATGSIQAIYAVPADKTAVAGRADAFAHEISVVQAWYDGQTGGKHPVFEKTGGAVSVITVQMTQTQAELGALSNITFQIEALIRAIDPTIKAGAKLAITVEGAIAGTSCGITGGVVLMAVDNCMIYPSATSAFPFNGTYLTAHELTHLLGAVDSCAPNHASSGHVNDDDRDLLFRGVGGVDFTNLMLDPGNDDYYKHSIPGCADIDDSPLLGTG